MKKTLCYICLALIVIGGVVLFFATRTSKIEMTEVVVKQVEAKKLANEEIIWNLLDKYGLTLLEKIDTMMILKCESKFSQYAIGVNKNGSLDLGVAQWNTGAHKEISRECAFNIECAIDKMMQTYKKDGNFNQWVCAN